MFKIKLNIVNHCVSYQTSQIEQLHFKIYCHTLTIWETV